MVSFSTLLVHRPRSVPNRQPTRHVMTLTCDIDAIPTLLNVATIVSGGREPPEGAAGWSCSQCAAAVLRKACLQWPAIRAHHRPTI